MLKVKITYDDTKEGRGEYERYMYLLGHSVDMKPNSIYKTYNEDGTANFHLEVSIPKPEYKDINYVISHSTAKGNDVYEVDIDTIYDELVEEYGYNMTSFIMEHMRVTILENNTLKERFIIK